jgi:L-fuculose-phosphate aldolase
MTATEKKLRQAIIDKCLWMNASGLNQGTSGNISARYKDTMLITPSGIPYDQLKPKMIAAMTTVGEYGNWEGPLKPSTEWRFHLDILKARPEIKSVVHTHSVFATTLAITGREIPACHYMIAAFGGPNIRCAEYARAGSAELSRNALKALEGRTGCILGNHGLIAAGTSLDKAMWLAVELETLARQYYHTLLIGGPNILTGEQIEETMKGFAVYGLQDPGNQKPSPKEKKI